MMNMAKRQVSVTVELRRAIAQAGKRGVTRYRIAQVTGMPQSQVGRIASGETEPLLGTAEKIARSIGYKLALVPIVAK